MRRERNTRICARILEIERNQERTQARLRVLAGVPHGTVLKMRATRYIGAGPVWHAS